jgi:hypothetical protein
MKKGLVLLVLLLSLSLVSAIDCSDSDSDSGPDSYYTFGYVTFGSLIKLDTCTSTSILKEFYCDTDYSYTSRTVNCANVGIGCAGGQCIATTCGVDHFGECNPVLEVWCDQAGEWQSSDYCEECEGYDSTCSETCIEGACDYNTNQYCDDGEWKSDYYCDVNFCGDNDYSEGDCFCTTSETEETSCTDLTDNDCDGYIDCNDPDCTDSEGCQCSEGGTPQSCGSSTGVCETGYQECVDGSWGICSGIEASEEICDGLDNDCDGDTDEACVCLPGDTRDCGESVGVCQAGVQVCQDDGSWSICYGASYAASEIEECNGLDDDCDGYIDEGCACTGGTTQECGSDVGSCVIGLQTCDNGTWGDCEGAVESFPEVCGDLLDNDCDGLVDYDDDNCGTASTTGNDEESSSGNETSSDSTTGDEETTDEDTGRSSSSDEESSDEEVTDEGTSSNDTSGLSSSDPTTSDEGSSFIFLVIVVLIVVLVLGGGAYFYMQKKGKLTIGKAPISRSAPIQSKPPMRVKVQEQRSYAPTAEKSTSKLKSSFDKVMDKSFEKSKELFGK